MPDFWTSRLDPTIPVATSILDALKKNGFPKEIAIEPAITTAIFKNMPAKARVEFYGEFLFYLRAWQQRAMLEHQRFPFDFAWPPPLSNAVELFKQKQAAEKASSNS
jgi:hypothetical protein